MRRRVRLLPICKNQQCRVHQRSGPGTRAGIVCADAFVNFESVFSACVYILLTFQNKHSRFECARGFSSLAFILAVSSPINIMLLRGRRDSLFLCARDVGFFFCSGHATFARDRSSCATRFDEAVSEPDGPYGGCVDPDIWISFDIFDIFVARANWEPPMTARICTILKYSKYVYLSNIFNLN